MKLFAFPEPPRKQIIIKEVMLSKRTNKYSKKFRKGASRIFWATAHISCSDDDYLQFLKIHFFYEDAKYVDLFFS